jgi:hypothetical protein
VTNPVQAQVQILCLLVDPRVGETFTPDMQQEEVILVDIQTYDGEDHFKTQEL